MHVGLLMRGHLSADACEVNFSELQSCTDLHALGQALQLHLGMLLENVEQMTLKDCGHLWQPGRLVLSATKACRARAACRARKATCMMSTIRATHDEQLC